MKIRINQLICGVTLIVTLCTCSTKSPDTSPGAIIENAIPNGLVPGSALTLKGRDFGAVQSVQFANVNVAASNFIRTATNELTLKVPANAQAGDVRIVGEKGLGQPRQMALLTGASGLTTDNVSTNVGTITQGYFSDVCSPTYMSFCYKGACVGYLIENSRKTSECEQGYWAIEKSVETIAGSEYDVFKPRAKYQQLILKFEKNRNATGYTGFVFLQTPNGDTYAGNVLKDRNIMSYSLRDGSELKLCRTDLGNHFPSNRDDLCPRSGGGCSTCQ